MTSFRSSRLLRKTQKMKLKVTMRLRRLKRPVIHRRRIRKVKTLQLMLPFNKLPTKSKRVKILQRKKRKANKVAAQAQVTPHRARRGSNVEFLELAQLCSLLYKLSRLRKTQKLELLKRRKQLIRKKRANFGKSKTISTNS